VENAGRSQIAAAFALKHGLVAESAGTHPAERLNPTVVQVMKEIGIDISASRPKLLTPQMVEEASLVVTMGCSVEEVCPRPIIEKMRKKLMDWGIDDPKGKSAKEVRKIRDQIERNVTQLSSSL
jgi:protein-tyrosine-phosphatase